MNALYLNNLRKASNLSLLGMSFFLLVGCAADPSLSVFQNKDFSGLTKGDDDFIRDLDDPKDPDDPKDGPDNPVCDPFDGGGQTSGSNGIRAEISYHNQDVDGVYNYWNYDDLLDLYSPINAVNATVYMSKFWAPTREFTQGFIPSGSDTPVTKDNGELLDEFFSLRFETVLKLPEGYPAGYYELSILSDDGIALYIDNERIIDSDGDHPTRMGCVAGATGTNRGIYMSPETQKSVELLYYQGPRMHIALVAMWRYLGETEADAQLVARDSSCGLQGNNTFFNPSNNSQPQAAYLALINPERVDRWEPIPESAFYLPGNQTNPCVDE